MSDFLQTNTTRKRCKCLQTGFQIDLQYENITFRFHDCEYCISNCKIWSLLYQHLADRSKRDLDGGRKQTLTIRLLLRR